MKRGVYKYYHIKLSTDMQRLMGHGVVNFEKDTVDTFRNSYGQHYYTDNRLHYLLPHYFIHQEDYKSGLTFYNWFKEERPADHGLTKFLFELSYIVYQCNELAEAEMLAHRAFFSCPYIFYIFMGQQMWPAYFFEIAQWELDVIEQKFTYDASMPQFSAYAQWLVGVFNTPKFLDKARRYAHLQDKLKFTFSEGRAEIIEELSNIAYD
jgi:hypothetical protein